MITMNMSKDKRLICVKCNYSWIPKKNPEEIKECPNCKSRKWRKKNEI